MLSRAVFWMAAAGLAAFTVPSANGAITLMNGQAVSLSSILASNDRQVNIGDKLFTFNGYNSTQFPATGVFISGYIAPNANDGIGFDITGGFGDVIPGDGASSALNLQYSVEVQAASLVLGYRLKDVALVFNGAASGTGSFSRVNESVYDGSTPTPTLLTTLQANVTPGGPTFQQASQDFSPATYTKFSVTKDVQFFAFGPGDFASASFIRQSFSQTVLPGPGSIALFGLGAVLIVRRRRD